MLGPPPAHDVRETMLPVIDQVVADEDEDEADDDDELIDDVVIQHSVC